MEQKLDIPRYTTKFSTRNKLYRLVWGFVRVCLFKPFGTIYFNKWRKFLLSLFGAKIGDRTVIYSSANIWMPCNLEVGRNSCIGPNTFIYNPAIIKIGNKVTISQNSYLCAGSHDIHTLSLDFIQAPIVIEDFCWVCANSFVMMGVTMKEGSVLGAASSLFKSTETWSVYGGSPAEYIKKREIYGHRI